MIGVIQLFMVWIVNVETSLLLGRFWIAMSKPMLVAPSSNEAIFAISTYHGLASWNLHELYPIKILGQMPC